MEKQTNNIAYIDGQNLYMGTAKSDPKWKIDLARLRVYLELKYSVQKAYYFLGYVQEGASIQKLYEEIQAAGYILVFRQHNSAMLGKKKGNVDSDTIFSIMKQLCEGDDFNKIILISGDGDYKMLVDYLVQRGKLEKILFPNLKFRSSLYKSLTHKYYANLGDIDTRRKIQKRKGSLR